MRLASLLAGLPDSVLERLAVEHVRTDQVLARPQLCSFLEGAIKSFRFVSSFVTNRQPPTFAILTLLLESADYQRLSEGFREGVMAETHRLIELIDQGELLARDQQLHLYRRALYEARRNDLDVNPSEAAMLAVLRRELRIAQVEHFLIEHHQDLREFWDRNESFEHEINALCSAGIIFHVNDLVIIPEDVAPALWQSLGVDMPTESARRLYGHLSNSELAEVLGTAGSRSSGSKEERLERLVLERIQPRVALQTVGIATLKDICRESGAPSTGNKENLIERIVIHFSQGRDQQEEEPVEVRPAEARRLSETQFNVLFSALLLQEMSDILRRSPDLRQTGTKETRIRTLWNAQRSESTLLGELMNRQLEDILHRLGLRLSGSKGARIDRIIERFERSPTELAVDVPVVMPTDVPAAQVPLAPEIAANQELFRQRASSPQTSLQPWLETLLDAHGMVRCYATEDSNPTKQLKNKLSQAAAANDGVLVLLFADEIAYAKAREALIERWMANAEWPKSVACIALAYPSSNPGIYSLIDRVPNPWSRSIRSLLFPEAEVVTVAMEGATSNARCSGCAAELPRLARYCPNCGAPSSN